MFDVTKYSNKLGFVLEKTDGKPFLIYGRFDAITGEKLQNVKESLDLAQILTLRDRLQKQLDNINALINDLAAVKEV